MSLKLDINPHCVIILSILRGAWFEQAERKAKSLRPLLPDPVNTGGGKIDLHTPSASEGVLMNQCAYLFLNGEYADKEPLAELARGNGLVIGVDGGTQFLLSISLLPHIIIGDMDSLSQTQLHHFGTHKATILCHPPEKDETDFELALNYATLHGCTSILVFGAIGGRIDHTLANILLPVRYLDRASIRLIHGTEELFFISTKASIMGKVGDIISLIPIAGNASEVKTIGLRYPLYGERLLFGESRGISNELIADEAMVTISSGTLLCIHTPKKL